MIVPHAGYRLVGPDFDQYLRVRPERSSVAEGSRLLPRRATAPALPPMGGEPSLAAMPGNPIPRPRHPASPRAAQDSTHSNAGRQPVFASTRPPRGSARSPIAPPITTRSRTSPPRRAHRADRGRPDDPGPSTPTAGRAAGRRSRTPEEEVGRAGRDPTDRPPSARPADRANRTPGRSSNRAAPGPRPSRVTPSDRAACSYDTGFGRSTTSACPTSKASRSGSRTSTPISSSSTSGGPGAPPASTAIPHLVDLQKKYGPDKLKVVGIACEEAPPSSGRRRWTRSRGSSGSTTRSCSRRWTESPARSSRPSRSRRCRR